MGKKRRKGLEQVTWIVMVLAISVLVLLIVYGIYQFMGGSIEDLVKLLTPENIIPNLGELTG